MQVATRVAMWSGPRNISTALMRSWENRPDTIVCDEPFYANYLLATGLDHPGRDAVIASQPTDWRAVVEGLLAPLPTGIHIFYQKHMAHHLAPQIGRDWMAECVNALLIRDPAEMLTSLDKVLTEPTARDTGLPQQVDLFHWLREQTGTPPLVIDARDILQRPREMLSALCDAVGVPFSERMLSWPPGRRESDGIWAPHWYATVEASTGFAPYQQKSDVVRPELEEVLQVCRDAYDQLQPHRLVV